MPGSGRASFYYLCNMAVRNKKNYIIDLAQLIAWVGLLLSPALVDLTVTGKLPSFVRILKGTAFFVLPLFTLYALNYYYLVPSFLHKKGKARWFFLINAVILLAWNLVRFTRPVNFPQEVVDQFGQHIWAMYVGSILAAVFLQALVIAIAVGIRHIMRSNEQKMEAEEQQRLRRRYIDEFKENLKSTLDQVYIEREDGTYEKLKKKPPLN